MNPKALRAVLNCSRFPFPCVSTISLGLNLVTVFIAPCRTDTSAPSTSILIAETLIFWDIITLSSVWNSTRTTGESEAFECSRAFAWPINVGLGTASFPMPGCEDRAILNEIMFDKLLERRLSSKIAKLLGSGSIAKTNPDGPTFFDSQTVCVPMLAPASTTTSDGLGDISSRTILS